MVVCIPGIFSSLVKLRKYSTNPALEHFNATKGIYYYLSATRNEGIYYWRKTKYLDLPLGDNPKYTHSSNYIA